MRLLFAMLMLPFTALCQKKDTVLFKGANRISVVTAADAQANYKAITNLLLENGFSIDKKDNDLLTVKTQERSVKPGGIYFLNLIAKDSEIVVSGRFRLGAIMKIGGVEMADDYDDIKNTGMKGSYFKSTFLQMEDFAKKLNGRIYYFKL